MRIKLEAEPMEYFVESIKHMAFIKSAVSLVVALFAAMLPKVPKKAMTQP